MDYFIVPVELLYEPTDEDEVSERLSKIQTYFNETFESFGFATMCLGVSRWKDESNPIASFMSMDIALGSQDRTYQASTLFRTAITNCKEKGALHVMTREERLAHVSE